MRDQAAATVVRAKTVDRKSAHPTGSATPRPGPNGIPTVREMTHTATTARLKAIANDAGPVPPPRVSSTQAVSH